MIKYKKTNVALSQHLRKHMTPEERHLWYDFLKKLPVSVKRQVCIENYIVDFYVPSNKTVIELDGAMHYMLGNKQDDEKRDAVISEHGITVLRFTNKELKHNFEGICLEIMKKLDVKPEDIIEKSK